MGLPAVPSHTCPFCKGASISQCQCARSDMKCGNGHEWHHDGDYIHAGTSDHASPQCCGGRPIAVVQETTMKTATSKTLTHRVVSRFVAVATEFPSQEALDKYLKDHPKADKGKHTVKKPGESAKKPSTKKEWDSAFEDAESKFNKGDMSSREWMDFNREYGEGVE